MSPADLLAHTLTALAGDDAALARLAWASLHSHAESGWVRELGYRLAVDGHHVLLEGRASGMTRVDLVVDGAPVEVKSSFAVWAGRTTDAQIGRWLAKDLDALQAAPDGGVFLLTIAALSAECSPFRPAMRTAHDPTLGTPPAVLDAGLARYAGFLDSRHVPSSALRLGRGVAPDGGTVHFGALVARVPGCA